MEPQARGRSPSVGNQHSQHISNTPSPSNYNGHLPSPADNPSDPSFSQPFASNDISPPNAGNINFNYVSQQQYQQPVQEFDQFPPNGLNVPQIDPSDQQFQPDMLNVQTRFGGFPHQQGFAKQEMLLDPQLQTSGQFPDQPISPNDLVSNMSSPQNLAPTPPNHQMRSQHSEPTSPYTQGPSAQQQYSPNHSRHVSLDPATAYANGQSQDWTGIMQGPQFQGHRRTPSEYSDVSSSNAPSPYLTQNEAFDQIEQHHSPLLNPQPEPQPYNDALGMESVNISDPQQRQSPRHSPFVSPRLSAQPGLGPAQDAQFVGLQEPRAAYGGTLMPETYGGPTEQFPMVQPEQRLGSNDFGRADQYDVPQINVDPAPMQQSGMEQTRSPTDIDALSPPDRGRRRGRAKSDTHIPRAGTPSSTQVNLSSPESASPMRGSSLSPFDPGFSPNGSRSPSPVPRSPSARRSSTSAIPNRDYILELADPNRPPASGNEKGRVQKHPATFSCHLCPKKFTRAYNLRSHLRTHTDERPFVCTVCSKAFARQHDRKRHEGLHSGEKKFVCRGELGTGAQWGCGRRFARADALGRHFRSEAGRVCIKPLLDEEAEERQRMDENMLAQRMGAGLAPQPGLNGMPMQQQFAFPAALLQQFPALQGLQWDNMPAGPDEDDYSGRSSFDASSGGDYYEEEDGAGGYMSDNPMGTGFQQHHGWPQDQGWKSDIEG